MAVLSFTPADALQTIVVDAGLYECEISEIEGPKASSSGKSMNFFVTIRITQNGKYKGKEKTIALSSGSSDPSQLGNMQWYPQSTFLQLNEAINNKKTEVIQQQINTDELLHKTFIVGWGVITVEGRLQNNLTSFAPLGSPMGPSF